MPEFAQDQTVQFKSEVASRVFDSLVDSFIEDYMTRKYFAEKSGWRTLAEIAAKTGISTSLLYGKHSTINPALDEPIRRGLVETRIFPGERGRGGEVLRLRISYERDAVKEVVSHRIKRGKSTEGSSDESPGSIDQGFVRALSETSSIFSTLPLDQIRRVVQYSEKVSFSPNQAIVHEGDIASGFFIIVDGQVEVKQRGRSIRRMGRGQFFGETSLGEQETRSADIIAVEQTTCLKQSATQLKDLINIDPQIAIRLLEEIVKRNRGITRGSLEDEHAGKNESND